MSPMTISHPAFRAALAVIIVSITTAAGVAAPPPPADESWPALRRDLFQNREISEGSTFVALDAPAKAEDAALVPMTMLVRQPPGDSRRVVKMSLVIDENPVPLAGTFTLASVASGQCTIGEWIGPTKAVNDYQTRDSQYTDAVWTGSEMMLYGAGYYAYSGDFSSTAPRTEGGLRFNASGNAWSVMSSAGQPVNNGYPNGIVEWRSAWTGTQLIVMGCPFSDSGGISCAWAGARYSPATDSWTSINATGAIAGKYYYDSSLRLYWAGGKVLVWRVGGFYKPTAPGNPLPPALSSYDPVADVWQTLADPPQTDAGNGDAPIMGDSAVWDGTELIAVGHSGCIRANQFCYSDHLSSEIYIYNLASNQWRQVTNYAPTLSDRVFANVAWTGTEVIVWGGDVPVDDGTGTNTVGMPTNTGARYKPSTGTWTAMSTTNAPVARDYPVARWTGTIGKFVVWGGQVPPPPGVNAPDAFPQTGAMYSPASNSWTTMRNTGAPLGRYAGLSVWTGTEVIVWGGQACTADNTTFADCNNGGRFNASTNNWSPLLARGPDGAPGNSYWYSIGMASSGSDSLVFGDRQSYSGSQTLTDGSLYRPATDDWTPIGTTGAPSARQDAYLGWGGGKYFAWGGTDHSLGTPLHDGALYDPVTQTWSPMAEPTIDMSQRTGYEHAAGTYFYLWGGYSYATSGGVNDGIVYDPATNAWTALPSANAPSARCQALSTTDSNGNFVLWGGYDCASTWPSTGAVYNHATNAWTPLAASGSVPANTTYGDFYDGGFGVSHLGVLNGGDIFLWDARAASGWRYAFGSNAWQSISAAGAPPAMYYGGQAMQVAGRDVVFFGGDTRAQNSGVASAVQGYAYRPEADAWSQLPLDRAPSARTGAYMGVIGSELMVWGGSTYTGYGGGPGITNTGALYCYDNRSGALSADLAVSGHFAPATIATSMPATLVVQVTNTGPDTATGVGFTSDTTQDFAFTSIVTADTNCTVPAAGTSGAITCQLGSLNSGASKSVTFALSPFAAGTYNLPISTTANEPDPVMANNSASMPITVIDDLVFFSGFEN